MNEGLMNYLGKANLIMKTKKHSLYISEKSRNLLVYNGEKDEIWEVSLDDLVDVGWKS